MFTTIVTDVLSDCVHVVEANVYGVKVPGGGYNGKVKNL